MAFLSKKVLLDSLSLINQYDTEVYKKVKKNEQSIDNYEDKLGTYLLKLSGKDLSESDTVRLNLILHLIGDFERISDHAVNIAKSAKEVNKKGLSFSRKAAEEINVFSELITAIISTAVKSFEENDLELATYVEPMEELADKLNKQIKKRHVKRLTNGKCTIELGFVLSDIITDFERIADHCSNIAVGILQSKEELYESHEYIENLEKGENTLFRAKYLLYKEKYVLP